MQTEETTSPAPPSAEPQPERKCQIRQVLGPTIDRLLEQAPENPSVRAHVLGRVLQGIPPEITTYQGVKNWIETTIDPKMVKHTQSGRPLVVDVSISEREYGSCHYLTNASGSGRVQITRAEMERLVQEALDEELSMEDLVDRVYDKIREDAVEQIPTESGDGYDYSNYDAQGTEGREIELDEDLQSAVEDWLRANNPDALDVLQ